MSGCESWSRRTASWGIYELGLLDFGIFLIHLCIALSSRVRTWKQTPEAPLPSWIKLEYTSLINL